MADRIVNVGIIGCGGIANGKHLPALSKIENVRIVALCDIIEERAVKAKKEYGTPDAKVYVDYHELLKDDSIEIRGCTQCRKACNVRKAHGQEL